MRVTGAPDHTSARTRCQRQAAIPTAGRASEAGEPGVPCEGSEHDPGLTGESPYEVRWSSGAEHVVVGPDEDRVGGSSFQPPGDRRAERRETQIVDCDLSERGSRIRPGYPGP